MKFGSVCSGIEAASVAWEQLGWECSFVSEIDHFPSAVLNHRYPDVPNFGDFTTITYEKVKTEGKYPTIDVLIGGTPCQSFSVAGLRKGLESENGNLALEFVRLLSRLRPRWFIWENVPGVFSSSGGSDFASILAGFTGRVVGVPAEGWRNSGAIEGIAEAYDVSWRVLDAQYFGVAQRRRRVFVVGHLVECAGRIRGEEFQEHGRIPNLAAAVLFESDCLQGNPEPRREKRKGASSSTHGGVDASGWKQVTGALDTECGGNKLTHQTIANGHIVPTWWNGEDLAATLTKQNANGAQRMPDKDNFGAVIEPVAIQGNLIGRDSGGPQGIGMNDEGIMYTLTKADVHGVLGDSIETQDKCYPIQDQATRFNGKRGENQDGKGNGLGIEEESDPMFTFTKGDKHAVFQDSTLSLNSRQMGLDVGDEIASTILSTDYKEPQVVLEPQYYESHPNDSRVTGPNDIANAVTSRYGTGGGNTPLVAQPGEIEPIAVDTYNQTINEHTTQSLSSAATDVNHYGAVIEPVVFDRAAFNQGENAKFDPLIEQTQLMPSLVARGPHGVQHINMAIRRLTPIECERLQGFAENWTRIPYRGKHEDSCPDGPRYKACGNSMATPVIKWLGERIQMITDLTK